MQKTFVLTLTGPDRIGVVDNLTEILLQHSGNVETSRMARLGGEFAVLMLVAMPADQFPGLEGGLDGLVAQGYKLTLSTTEEAPAAARSGWLPYHIKVHGADHEGIIHEVAHYLSKHEINIESVETATTPAPHTGTPFFTMTALVLVPPGQAWQAGLDDVAHRLNVDIDVAAVKS